MDFVTVKEAAIMLGVHENTIRNLERNGTLRGYRDHRNYRVFDLEEISRLKEKRNKIEEKNFARTILTGATVMGKEK